MPNPFEIRMKSLMAWQPDFNHEDAIFMHETSYRVLCDQLGYDRNTSPGNHPRKLGRDHLGVQILVSNHVEPAKGKWVFPEERYWIYEAGDEDWCRELGIGHEEFDLESLVAYKVRVPKAQPLLSMRGV